MTRGAARALAEAAAERTGKDYAVWRMPKWPAGAIAVDPIDSLPSEAIIFETVPAPPAAKGRLF